MRINPFSYNQHLTSWTCKVCGDRRPDKFISVLSIDCSEDFGAAPGSIKHNIRYCNDRPKCVEGAPTKRLRFGDEAK